ncbi:terminase large subunit [Kluyvera sp. SCKS090646]|uniref:Terminase large subunit n=1 Tax=Kluyvera sichuanensis TaxID=2725494 RepID=A0ABR6RYI7_9ENTR|nr:terminase large subunit [Kluyvera sichuanensis]MBC1188201.1 terminase large subunit [Kluyvera sichuanensis]
MAQWTTACTDWESRLVAGESIIPPPIFPDQAEQALGIFRELRVSDLPGKPTFGECSEGWVFDFVKAIFGGYDAETGNQLIREYGLLISKKNTKSTIAAGIMLTALILCWREDEEHLILAPTKEVADNSFKPAAGMIRADDELTDMFQIQDHIRTITHRVTRNTLKVVAADTDTVSGKKSGRILVDELWLFGKRANAEAMFMEALGGQVSRNEGWVIFLTTQSDEPPAGVFKERLDYWRSVRDGKISDPKTLGVLYEFPERMVEGKAYLESENFYITNPNIGRSVSSEWIADQLRKNQAKTDGTLQQFLAKHLNIEIGLNLRSDRWAGVDFWEQQARRVTFEDILRRSEVVTVGIDGGGLDDLLGLSVIGRDRETREWLCWCHAWAHTIALERRKSEISKLKDFERAGDLTIVKRVGEDIEQVADYVSRIYEAELLDKIGIDPSEVGQILDALSEAGIPDEAVTGVSQGWKLGGAIKTTERKLAEGVLLHGGQPLMAWCVGNARVEPRGNAILITKQASGKGKIDPLMATFNAVTLMALNPEPVKKDYQVFFV